LAGIGENPATLGNQNAFRHGLASVSQRRVNDPLNPAEQSIREEILAGLLADKNGAVQDKHRHECWPRLSPATYLCWSPSTRQSTGVIRHNPKARTNPKALAQLDGYKRPLVGSLSAGEESGGIGV